MKPSAMEKAAALLSRPSVEQQRAIAELLQSNERMAHALARIANLNIASADNAERAFESAKALADEAIATELLAACGIEPS